MSFWDGIGSIVGGPIARGFGLDKKDRAKWNPQQQYAYGSKEALARKNAQFNAGEQQGNANVQAGVNAGNNAAHTAATDLYGMAGGMGGYSTQQAQEAGANNAGFYNMMRDYGQTRPGQINAAGQQIGVANQLINSAAGLPQSYQRTDQSAFQAQQDANMRQALALGSTGGAAGLRAALAGQTAANQQAAQQADITRAQEQNNIIGLQQNALTSGAGVLAQGANTYGNVGSADQNAAGMYSTRQQANNANNLTGMNSAANTIATTAGIQQSAANSQIGAGSGQRSDNLNADVGVNTAQYTGNQGYDLQRQKKEENDYNQKWKPIMSMMQQ